MSDCWMRDFMETGFYIHAKLQSKFRWFCLGNFFVFPLSYSFVAELIFSSECRTSLKSKHAENRFIWENFPLLCFLSLSHTHDSVRYMVYWFELRELRGFCINLHKIFSNNVSKLKYQICRLMPLKEHGKNNNNKHKW